MLVVVCDSAKTFEQALLSAAVILNYRISPGAIWRLAPFRQQFPSWVLVVYWPAAGRREGSGNVTGRRTRSDTVMNLKVSIDPGNSNIKVTGVLLVPGFGQCYPLSTQNEMM